MTLASVIIVNFHTEPLLLDCLGSLYAHHDPATLQVIVVNNGGSLDTLRGQSFGPWVTILDAGENVGFSRANNLGFAAATGNCVLYLNPDTVFSGPVLQRCIEHLEADPRIGALGCRLLKANGTLQLSYHDGYKLFRRLLWRNPFVIKCFGGSRWAARSMDRIRRRHTQTHDANWLTGAFLMLRREDVLENEWLWDPAFFMYWEDVELCRRIAEKKRLRYFAEVSIVHLGGGGTDVPAGRFRMIEHGKALYLEKRYGALGRRAYWILHRLELLVERLVMERSSAPKSGPAYRLWKMEFDYYAEPAKARAR